MYAKKYHGNFSPPKKNQKFLHVFPPRKLQHTFQIFSPSQNVGKLSSIKRTHGLPLSGNGPPSIAKMLIFVKNSQECLPSCLLLFCQPRLPPQQFKEIWLGLRRLNLSFVVFLYQIFGKLNLENNDYITAGYPAVDYIIRKNHQRVISGQ